jgi:hypothetical protein
MRRDRKQQKHPRLARSFSSGLKKSAQIVFSVFNNTGVAKRPITQMANIPVAIPAQSYQIARLKLKIRANMERDNVMGFKP